MHNDCCLLILYLNTGLTYYQAFCSRVKQSYQDAAHFTFSSMHIIITDNVKTSIHSCKGAPPAVALDTDFTLGQDVLYTGGERNQAIVVYKGAMLDGEWHTFCKSDDSKLVTPGSHFCFLEQPIFFKHSFHPT
jgi:hypothetical protein